MRIVFCLLVVLYTIQYIYSPCTAQINADAGLQTIEINPNPATVYVRESRQFYATGYYLDGSMKDLTDEVHWTLTPPGVTQYVKSERNVVTGLGEAGGITISAELSGIRGSAALTVTQLQKISHRWRPDKQSGKKAGTYWLVFDVKKPSQLRLCEKPIVNTDLVDCPYWDYTREFFDAGAVIRLQVIHAKFRSTFNVTADGITIRENLPEIRGASPPQNPGGGPSGNPDEQAVVFPPSESQEQRDAFAKVQGLYDTAKSNLYFTTMESYIGVITDYEQSVEQVVDCVMRPESPKIGLLGLLAFAQLLSGDATACDEDRSNPFVREPVFNDLTNRTDRLRQDFLSLKAAIPGTLTDLEAGVKASWNAFDSEQQQFKDKYQPTAGEGPYLKDGAVYNILSTQVKYLTDPNLAKMISQVETFISGFLFRTFSAVNSIYQRSESGPIDIPIKQYSTNFLARLQVVEVVGFVPYSFPLSTSSSQDGEKQASLTNAAPSSAHADPTSSRGEFFLRGRLSTVSAHAAPNPSSGDAAPTPSSAQADATQNPSKGSVQNPPGKQVSPPPSPGTTGKAVYSGNFDVHKFYRANIVAGFFASTLKTRQYGVTNNGSISTFVPVIGPSYRPQYHYFVGLNYYIFGKRDLFPGALKNTDYLKPGLLLGYGLDSANNYLIGANWEFRWGINLGSGLHIGQEVFLAPGIQPGLTTLPSMTTTPPTVNRTRYGAYGSIGFDLATMKSTLGQLFGGSSVPTNK
jgi:hypothetical protein